MTPWRRPGPTPRQQHNDLLIGLLFVALSELDLLLLNSFGRFALGDPPAWIEQMLWTAGVALPLLWRRRYPEASTIAVSVIFVIAQFRHNPETIGASASLATSLYTLGAWGRDRQRAATVRIAIILGMFIWLAATISIEIRHVAPDAFPDAAGPLPPLFAALLNSVLFNLVFFVFAYKYGNSAWLAARREAELAERTEALRRSQAELASRAVVEERVRIARELHDVVAHHVSVIGVQAGAARRVMDRDTTKAKTALSAVEETARAAIGELRRLLGVLRDRGGGAEPATVIDGLGQVGSLLDGARGTGLTVEYRVYGDPVPLPDSLSLAVYRIVQESLTNTIKHARASTVDVRLRYLSREVEVDVTDDGHPIPPPRPAGAEAGVGMGLVGMRERIAAHEGVLEAGPRSGGGYRVRARLPLPDHEPAPAKAAG
jgi:signal transduction histidine kinase